MPKPGNRTRSTARAAEKEENVSTVAPIFRRYPRLGSSYQTKVLPSIETPYQPSRQVPVLLSKDFPDVSHAYVLSTKDVSSGELKVGRFACCEVLWCRNRQGKNPLLASGYNGLASRWGTPVASSANPYA